MNRKSVLFIFLILILGVILLTGCGGGGGSKDPVLIEKGPSSDYLGLEDGAVLVFHSTTFNNYSTPQNTQETITMKVKIYQGNIFKTSFESTIDTDVDGGFIEKDGNDYYDSGEWEVDSDIPDDRGVLIITNPISEIIPPSSVAWGACQGKVSVTVPIGTFQAWKFYKKVNINETDFTEVSLWFVPYLGYVKVNETDWEGETKVWNSESELTSYTF